MIEGFIVLIGKRYAAMANIMIVDDSVTALNMVSGRQRGKVAGASDWFLLNHLTHTTNQDCSA